LIILESTTYPGTSREVILPILEKSNLRAGEDFFLCFSPERIDPGNKKFPLTKIPKIVGGINEKSTLLGRLFYSKIIEKVISVSSIESAELVKLLENSFRLINIGLINEFAIVCNKLKVDVWEIIEAARTKPFGFMPFYPGPGIGGHCIPADPLYLSWKAKKLGFKTKMIDLASYTNRFMPRYVADRVEQLLRKKNIPIEKARLLILGVTYKKDILDLRESPAIDIIELLQNKGVKLNYHDPLIPYLRINRINLKRVSLTKDRLKSYDCIVLVTNHSGLDYKFIKNHARLIFDTRNVYKTRAKNIIKL
jgi:UDP-N-acetyl-D-glucosamine dehydrogenase